MRVFHDENSNKWLFALSLCDKMSQIHCSCCFRVCSYQVQFPLLCKINTDPPLQNPTGLHAHCSWLYSHLHSYAPTPAYPTLSLDTVPDVTPLMRWLLLTFKKTVKLISVMILGYYSSKTCFTEQGENGGPVMQQHRKKAEQSSALKATSYRGRYCSTSRTLGEDINGT